MTSIAALIVRDTSRIQFAGLDLVDRAGRLVRRAGIEQVEVVDDDRPFAAAPDAELLLVVPERVVAEPAVFKALVARGLRGAEEAAVVVDAADASTDLSLLSWRAVARVRTARRVRPAIHRLTVESMVG